MCYDFELTNNQILTIINFYKKNNAYEAKKKNIKYDYSYDDLFFYDISKIIKNVNDKNMIIFAGDFNTNYRILKKIENIGFEEKTKLLGSTMVDKKHNWHNDCIFVNNIYSECHQFNYKVQ
jgi:hypothetical protein